MANSDVTRFVLTNIEAHQSAAVSKRSNWGCSTASMVATACRTSRSRAHPVRRRGARGAGGAVGMMILR